MLPRLASSTLHERKGGETKRKERKNGTCARGTHTVSIPQCHTFVENNVDLDVEFIARVISLQTLDLLDRLCKPHGQVQQDISLVSGRCCACEVPDMLG